MPSLKSLRLRINSVKSTRKITQAMKMVAAAKLRRAQTQAEAARPYAERMERMLASLGASVAGSPDAPKLLVGTGADKVHVLVVVTAERGLCGGFNSGNLALNVNYNALACGGRVRLRLNRFVCIGDLRVNFGDLFVKRFNVGLCFGCLFGVKFNK